MNPIGFGDRRQKAKKHETLGFNGKWVKITLRMAISMRTVIAKGVQPTVTILQIPVSIQS